MYIPAVALMDTVMGITRDITMVEMEIIILINFINRKDKAR